MDPTMDMVVQIASLPIFWLGIACFVGVALIIALFGRKGQSRSAPSIASVPVRKSGFVDPSLAAEHILAAAELRGIDEENSGARRRRKPKRKTIQQMLQRIEPGTRILWIDDHPEDNADEVAAFELAGCYVVTVRTNATALNILSDNQFDVVISDVERDEAFGPSGLQLFQQMYNRKSISALPPVIFYTDVDFAEFGYETDYPDLYAVQAFWNDEDEPVDPLVDSDDETSDLVIPSTNRPNVLVDLVHKAVSKPGNDRSRRVPAWYNRYE